MEDSNNRDQNISTGLSVSDVEKTPSPQPYTNPNEPAKKEDVKIMSAVVPVLSYAAAPPTYPPMEEGVPIFSGAQPQPAAFQTTYQQGVNLIIDRI